jgi:NAD(P)H-flavin reductase
VALLPNGRMSGWLHAEAQPADRVDLIGPLGTCFYTPADSEQPLLLAGTGTGLAPLYGIARDALSQNHRGEIHLFHGCLTRAGLYLERELRELQAKYPNFHYYPCALNGPVEDEVHLGAIDAYIKETLPSLKGHRVYLCGHPDTVKLLQKNAFLAGASMHDILADAFLPSVARTA